MKKYRLKVTIKTEAVFNSGEEEQNLVNEKVLCDENGFVYLHGKTLKGQLRKQGEWLAEKLDDIADNREKKYSVMIDDMFGKRGERIPINPQNKANDSESEQEYDSEYKGTKTSLIQVSNLEIRDEIKEYFINLNSEEETKISPFDLIEAQTNVRTKIQIGEDGVVKDNRTMKYHTVKNGLEFYSNITLDSHKKDHEIFLYMIVATFDKLGASTNRGRGDIEAELEPIGHNKTFKLEKGVLEGFIKWE